MNSENTKPSAKKVTMKKPKDKPKRPLSAYNIFLKAEREKIVKFIKGEGPDEKDPDQPAADLQLLMTNEGRISFEQMGKLIGKRWKTLSPESHKKYSDMALIDAERYKTAMADYKAKNDERARKEAAFAKQIHSSAVTPASVYGASGGVESGFGSHFDYAATSYPRPSSRQSPPVSYGGYPPPMDYGRSEHLMPTSAYGDYPHHQQYNNYYSQRGGGYGAPPYSSSRYYPSQHATEHSSSVSTAPKGYPMPAAHHPDNFNEQNSGQMFYPPQFPSHSQRPDVLEEPRHYHQVPHSHSQGSLTGSIKRPRTHGPY
mmetsp:Transcript_20821/g.29693  ORF Transcript_20821/g.29693 Transcript_20821/m.29693 type:complete len:314 (-) Transcript_20821:213-1154(-)